MKQSIPLFLLFFSLNLFSQTCLPGSTSFNTQQQIDDFATDYPGCTEILGNVLIQTNAITSLSGLAQLETIGGRLTIRFCDNLLSLNGLHNLTSIGGTHLFIQSNDALTDLSGLESLTTVSGNLLIRNNDALEDF